MLRRLPVLILLTACVDPVTQQQVDRVVYAWMQCIDCMDHERESVVALGDAAVPRLRAILLDGPPPAHVAAINASMQALAQSAPAGSAPSPAVIAAQLDSFRSMYRRRALLALTGIASVQAHSALCAALAAAVPATPISAAVDSGLVFFPAAPCP